jgi:hypothetical protein
LSRHVAAVSPKRRVGWIVLAVVLAVGGTVCIGAALRGSGEVSTGAVRHVEPDVRSAPSAPRGGTAKTPAVRADPSVPPVHLSIPAIDVSHDLLELGLNPDDTVEVPPHEESEFPGWFRLGPSPGQVGSSVILGHVDSLQGPAVFYKLRYLRRGDRVDVRLEDRSVAHFVVRKVATYPNDQFPAHEVYASHGYAALNLVTCGGAYDKARGGYQSNVVAYTRLVGTTQAAA